MIYNFLVLLYYRKKQRMMSLFSKVPYNFYKQFHFAHRIIQADNAERHLCTIYTNTTITFKQFWFKIFEHLNMSAVSDFGFKSVSWNGFVLD